MVVVFSCYVISSGLKEYIGANPAITSGSSSTVVQSNASDFSGLISEFEDAEAADQFYDAIADDSSSSSEDEDSDNEIEVNKVYVYYGGCKNWIIYFYKCANVC